MHRSGAARPTFIHLALAPVEWHDSHPTSLALPRWVGCESARSPGPRGAGGCHSTRGMMSPLWHLAHNVGEGKRLAALPAGTPAWQPTHVGKRLAWSACGNVVRGCARSSAGGANSASRANQRAMRIMAPSLGG